MRFGERPETLKDRVEIDRWRREFLVAQARLVGKSKAQADASVPRVTLDVVDVSFDAIPDPAERGYLMNLPTSFVLPPADVDRLREAASQILRTSPVLQSMARRFNHEAGTYPRGPE